MHLCNPDDVINARNFFLWVVYHTSWQFTFLYGEYILSVNIREQNLQTSLCPTYEIRIKHCFTQGIMKIEVREIQNSSYS